MATVESSELNAPFVQAMIDGDVDTFVSFYQDDAITYGLGPTPMSIGKAAIREEMAAMFQAIKCDTFEWDDSGEIAGDTAYHWGTWHLTGTNLITNEKLDMRARTLDVRKRQPDGSWKIAIDHASVFPTPPPS
jgi:ketosteroid isomerase-like protein